MVESPKEVLVKQNVQDLIEIANIDIGCQLEDPEVHPQGQDSFVVSFDKVPHSINAGETRVFPRYLADHYARHLADHLLIKSEKQINDPRERPKIIEEIYKGVRESYAAPAEPTQGEVIAEKVEKANVETPVKEYKPEPEDKPAPVLEPVKPKRTRKELFAECKELGIETKGNETVDALMEKIKVWSVGTNV
jgi:hypothetical protein